MMCMQLVVQAVQRCSEGSQEFASDETLAAALRSCEAKLKQLVHLPLAGRTSSATEPETESRPTEALVRHANIALMEKFTGEGVVKSAGVQPINRNSNAKSGRGTWR